MPCQCHRCGMYAVLCLGGGLSFLCLNPPAPLHPTPRARWGLCVIHDKLGRVDIGSHSSPRRGAALGLPLHSGVTARLLICFFIYLLFMNEH